MERDTGKGLDCTTGRESSCTPSSNLIHTGDCVFYLRMPLYLHMMSQPWDCPFALHQCADRDKMFCLSFGNLGNCQHGTFFRVGDLAGLLVHSECLVGGVCRICSESPRAIWNIRVCMPII